MPSAGPTPRDGGVYVAFTSFTLTKPTHTEPASPVQNYIQGGRSLDLAMTQPLGTGPTHCGDSTLHWIKALRALFLSETD